jgi:5-methylcytosine-specific restriction endonuclease McrA
MASKWNWAGKRDKPTQPMVNTQPSAGAYTYRWQKRRKSYLEEYPLCVSCKAQGKPVAATDIDHIKAHRGDLSAEAFWNEDNWQPLCHRCHGTKTNNESNQGRRTVVTGLIGSGKSTFVETNAALGDIVFDYDLIIATMIYGHGDKHRNPTDLIALLESMRYSLLDWINQTATRRNVWIICTNKNTAASVAAKVGADIIDLA